MMRFTLRNLSALFLTTVAATIIVLILIYGASILEFLNSNSGAFSVIFAAVVAISTVVYAILTRKLVYETKEMREAQTEPKISVVVQPREEWINFMDMIIQNVGYGPAYNISFDISPDFECRKGEYLSRLGAMKSGLRYLAPNQRIQFFLTSMVEDFEQKVKKSFEIGVKYQNRVGKTYEEKFMINFSEYVGLPQLGEPPMYEISKNIEQMQKDIHNLSTGFSRMKAIVYTKNDLEEEKREYLKEKKRHKEKDKK